MSSDDYWATFERNARAQVIGSAPMGWSVTEFSVKRISPDQVRVISSWEWAPGRGMTIEGFAPDENDALTAVTEMLDHYSR